MSEVKRLEPDYLWGSDFTMIEGEEGEYVTYDDYAALEAQNAAMREALIKIRDVCGHNAFLLSWEVAREALQGAGETTREAASAAE